LQRLHDVYFSSSSIAEVNISQDIAKEIQEAIEKNEITHSTCSRLKIAIKTNLSDTLSRFIRTVEYKKFAATVELHQTLIKVNKFDK